jgi:hypothetical protein
MGHGNFQEFENALLGIEPEPAVEGGWQQAYAAQDGLHDMDAGQLRQRQGVGLDPEAIALIPSSPHSKNLASHS